MDKSEWIMQPLLNHHAGFCLQHPDQMLGFKFMIHEQKYMQEEPHELLQTVLHL